MALIKCIECEKEISDKVKKCPHCGYKKKHSPRIYIFIIILLTISLLVLCGLLFFKKPKTNKEITLTKQEEQIYDYIIELVNDFYNPNGVKIYGVKYITFNEHAGNEQWGTENFDSDDVFEYLIKISGTNKVGGYVTNCYYRRWAPTNSTPKTFEWSVTTYESCLYPNGKNVMQMSPGVNSKWTELDNNSIKKLNNKLSKHWEDLGL